MSYETIRGFDGIGFLVANLRPGAEFRPVKFIQRSSCGAGEEDGFFPYYWDERKGEMLF